MGRITGIPGSFAFDWAEFAEMNLREFCKGREGLEMLMTNAVESQPDALAVFHCGQKSSRQDRKRTLTAVEEPFTRSEPACRREHFERSFFPQRAIFEVDRRSTARR